MTDYLNTVMLPHTDFPLKPKPSAAVSEEALLARWADGGLHSQRMEKNQGMPAFVLHDGPPYANGAVHMGHALNKVLKDAVNRAAWMSGRSVDYVPGWDCHGLPVEWRVEEERRKSGEPPLSTLDFRSACRRSAGEWMAHQKAEFMRMGVDGDWDNPYSTMDYASEAALAGELLRFRDLGLLRRSLRPVLWSPAERTALADAEVDYKEAESATAHVLFPVTSGPEAVRGALAVAWTTTPWTLPANQAVAYGAGMPYVVAQVEEVEDGCLLTPGTRLLVAASRLVDVMKAGRVASWHETATMQGEALAGTMLAHPLSHFHADYAFQVPMLEAHFVTDDVGTGLVHVAPAHGDDDFRLGLAHGLGMPSPVDDRGRLTCPGFEGVTVNTTHVPMADALRACGTLLAVGMTRHTVGFSQRSGARLLTRATPQWFVELDGEHALRNRSMEALEGVHFLPEAQRARLTGMLESRPDWCVSRQRTWGVPLPLFTNVQTGQLLRDPEVDRRVLDTFARMGADAWYEEGAAARFLGDDYAPDDWEMVKDVADVWFESGSTHAFVLRDRGMPRPADLYLEGSDQHRGWFQSSLLCSVATTGQAPYRTLLTHGFVLDDGGRKMSKSRGNVTSPADVVRAHGADALRLWALSADAEHDLKVGDAVLKGVAENYRRLRNTQRFVLGNLHGWKSEHSVPFPELPRMERWVLVRLWELDGYRASALADHRWYVFTAALMRFCTVDLSAFWFEACKDTLYCDAEYSLSRRSVLTVLDLLHRWLCTSLAPLLPFLAEEAWLARWGMDADSVHLERFMNLPEEWENRELLAWMQQARALRTDGTMALERARENRALASGSSCDAVVLLADLGFVLTDDEWVRVLQLGGFVRLGEGTATVTPALGDKCVRCRRTCEEVGASTAYPSLCRRCETVVSGHPASSAQA